MTRLPGAFLLMVLGASMAPRTALAQLDHLKCYKMKDSAAKTTYTADLGGLVAEPGCRVKVPAKLLCVETAKTNVTPAPPGAPAGTAAGRFVCYAVKCPKAALAPVIVTDQFGSRTVQPKTPKMLCAPAQFGPPTSTTTIVTTTTTSTAILLNACGDGVDNDGDGKVDYPTDPGCAAAIDMDETDTCPGPGCPACANGIDDDGDTLIDYPADPGCAAASSNSEGTTACSDGIDNDGDGLSDYPTDPGCSSLSDNDETDTCPGLGCPACSNGVDDDADTFIDYPADPGCAAASDTTE